VVHVRVRYHADIVHLNPLRIEPEPAPVHFEQDAVAKLDHLTLPSRIEETGTAVFIILRRGSRKYEPRHAVNTQHSSSVPATPFHFPRFEAMEGPFRGECLSGGVGDSRLQQNISHLSLVLDYSFLRVYDKQPTSILICYEEVSATTSQFVLYAVGPLVDCIQEQF